MLRDVQQAFYGLCVSASKQVLAAMMEADRVALCGAKNVPDPGRKAVRGGTTRSSVVLGGQRIAVTKPRARSLEHGELELPTFAWAADTDPLDMATATSMAAGVSTRRYAGTLDAVSKPEEPSSVSKSSVSRRWVAMTQAQLHEWLSAPLEKLDLPVDDSFGREAERASFVASKSLGFMKNIRKSPIPQNVFDRLDIAILRALPDDSRRPLNQIGLEVGLSPTACWTRIKRLETEGVIKRYTIDMDRGKLGFHDSVIVQVTLESHSDETLYEFGRTLSAISEVIEAPD